MVSAGEQTRFNWRLPLYVVGAASVVLLALFINGADASLLYIFGVIPLVCASLLTLLAVAAIRRKPCLALSVTLITFLVVSGALLKAQGALRPTLRWFIWSHRYKAEFLRIPQSPTGDLRHIEWDASGWGPIGSTITYLVFDPTDSLSVAAKSGGPGRFSGIPCEVPRVQRLESHWYAVTFYTEEHWGKRNRLDCSGSS